MKAKKSAQVTWYSWRLLIGAMSLSMASAEGTRAVLVAPPGRSKAILEEDAPPGRSKTIVEEDAPPGRSKAVLEEDT